jgi:adenylyl-sulfate kinase
LKLAAAIARFLCTIAARSSNIAEFTALARTGILEARPMPVRPEPGLMAVLSPRPGEQMTVNRFITSVLPSVSRAERCTRNGHEGGVIWLTGLSGAGKSTLSMTANRMLFDLGYQTYVLDGDNLRSGLNSDLGFSQQARSENIRRAAEVAALLADSGVIVFAAFISPLAEDRTLARGIVKQGFHEVYVSTSLAACEERDPKGLYGLARAGSIGNFTGISAPYESPVTPSLSIDTTRDAVTQSAQILADFVMKTFPLSSGVDRRSAASSSRGRQ